MGGFGGQSSAPGAGQLTRPPWGGLPSLGKRGLLVSLGKRGLLVSLGEERAPWGRAGSLGGLFLIFFFSPCSFFLGFEDFFGFGGDDLVFAIGGDDLDGHVLVPGEEKALSDS